jgi:trans-aconitate methyltransferase
MNSDNPIDLLFGDMAKLGPGANAHTLTVLRQLPRQGFPRVVDAGCGTGRQTLVLAKELVTVIHAVDTHEPFLARLQQLAQAEELGHLIQTHCLDMQEIPKVFQDIDLLWSEGAAYNIGFANALSLWCSAINPGGFAVISELSWLCEQVPDLVREFFITGYPAMQSVAQNRAIAENTGYQVLATHILPQEAWVTDYYDILEPRAKALSQHPDQSVRTFAAEMLKETEIFQSSAGSYGYVFYILQRL